MAWLTLVDSPSTDLAALAGEVTICSPGNPDGVNVGAAGVNRAGQIQDGNVVGVGSLALVVVFMLLVA